MTETPVVQENAHHYDSARDAIDAASAWEAATLGNWEYEVRASAGNRWSVRVNLLGGDQTRGFLVPRAKA